MLRCRSCTDWVSDLGRSHLRIPQTGTFFRPNGGETGDSDETGYAVESPLSVGTNARFRDFPERCEIEPPQTVRPSVLPCVAVSGHP